MNVLNHCTFEFNDEKLGEIIGENESQYFYYEFLKVPLTDDESNEIPEVILDMRTIHNVFKNMIDMKPIYVVNRIHFDNYLVKYRTGMRYIYQIKSMYSNDSDEPMFISANAYKHNSYHALFQQRASASNIAFLEAIISDNFYYNQFLNKRNDYFTFLDNFYYLISSELQKSKQADKWIKFQLNVSPILVFEFLHNLNVDYIKNFNKSQLGTQRAMDISELRIKTEIIKRTVIEVLINEVSKLFPFFGQSYYEHIFKKPNYTGLLHMTDVIVTIHPIDSNITISYDILNHQLKFKAPIRMNPADQSGVIANEQIEKEMDEAKRNLLNEIFYDPLLATDVKVIIIKMINELGDKKKLVKSVWIGCIVVIDNRLQNDPTLVETVIANAQKEIFDNDILFWYSRNQFDIENKKIIPIIKNELIHDIESLSVKLRSNHKFRQVEENIMEIDPDLATLKSKVAQRKRLCNRCENYDNLKMFMNSFNERSDVTTLTLWLIKEFQKKLHSDEEITIDRLVNECFETMYDKVKIMSMFKNDFKIEIEENAMKKDYKQKLIYFINNYSGSC